MGVPKRPDDLMQHNCLIYTRLDSVNVWNFSRRGQNYSVTVTGNLQCDNGDTLLEAALAGLGLLVLPHWMIHKYLDAGELEIVLQDYEPAPIPIHVVYSQRRYLPLKVRAFVEFIAEEFSGNAVLK